MFAKKFWANINGREVLQTIQRADVAFLLLAVLVGGFFALKVPIGYGTDESVQAFRAYSVGAGHITTKLVGTQVISGRHASLYGGAVPYSLIELEQYTSSGIRHAAICAGLACSKPSKAELQQADQLAIQPINSSNSYPIHFWGANSYSFIAFVPGAIGMDIARLANTTVGHMVKLARLSSVIFYALAVTWGLYLLRRSRVRWLLFSIALLPSALCQAASLGADAFLNASALVLFALIVKAFEEKKLSLPLKIAMILLAILVPLCKAPYIVLSLAVLFTPIFPGAKKGNLWRLGTLVVIGVPTLLWSMLSATSVKSETLFIYAGNGTPDIARQTSYILVHPVQYAYTVISSSLREDWVGNIGILTQQGVMVPTVFIVASLGLVALTALYAAPVIRKMFKRARTPVMLFLGLGLVGALAVASALYISYNGVGAYPLQGVQGRYFIPLLPFLALGLTPAIPFRLVLTPGRAARITFLSCNVALLIATVWWYHMSVYVWA